MSDVALEKRFARLKQRNRLLRRRLAKVQRRQRWMTIAGGMALTLIAAVGAASVSGDHFELLHPVTQHTRIAFYGGPAGKSAGFKFLDDTGKMTAFLGTSTQNAPQLQYFAADGSTRAEFDLDGNGVPALKMYGANGKMRCSIVAVPQGKSALLHFFDEDGNDRFHLGMGDDSPGISFWTADGKSRGSLYMNPKGNAEALQFTDADGKIRLFAALQEQGSYPVVQLYSSKGKMRLMASDNPDESASLCFFDNVVENKNPRLFIGCDSKGNPTIQFLGIDGKPVKTITP
jgi:hypothetical protein